jgi:hypothetical protein
VFQVRNWNILWWNVCERGSLYDRHCLAIGIYIEDTGNDNDLLREWGTNRADHALRICKNDSKNGMVLKYSTPPRRMSRYSKGNLDLRVVSVKVSGFV